MRDRGIRSSIGHGTSGSFERGSASLSGRGRRGVDSEWSPLPLPFTVCGGTLANNDGRGDDHVMAQDTAESKWGVFIIRVDGVENPRRKDPQ
jgi:hypothetical protein